MGVFAEGGRVEGTGNNKMEWKRSGSFNEREGERQENTMNRVILENLYRWKIPHYDY